MRESMKRCIVDFPQRRKDLSLRWFLFADSFLVSHRTAQSADYPPNNEVFILCTMIQFLWPAHLHQLSPQLQTNSILQAPLWSKFFSYYFPHHPYHHNAIACCSMAVSLSSFATSLGGLIGGSYSTFCEFNLNLDYTSIKTNFSNLKMDVGQCIPSHSPWSCSHRRALQQQRTSLDCCSGDLCRRLEPLLAWFWVQESSVTSTSSKNEDELWGFSSQYVALF